MVKQFLGILIIGAGMATSSGAATVASLASVTLPGASTGSIGPFGATPSPNNDNTAGTSPNAIPATVFFNAAGVVEYEFVVANSGGTTEYSYTLSATNNSGQVWTGFRFELGYGTGASFTSATAAGGVDFDLPTRDPAPTSSRYTVLDHQAASIDWSGATVSPISAVSSSFAVDVPDGLAALHPSGLNRYTLRATPVLTPIPEPGSLLLTAGGLAFLGWRCRLRR